MKKNLTSLLSASKNVKPECPLMVQINLFYQDVSKQARAGEMLVMSRMKIPVYKSPF